MNRAHLTRRYEHNYFRGWVVSTNRRGKQFTRYFQSLGSPSRFIRRCDYCWNIFARARLTTNDYSKS